MITCDMLLPALPGEGLKVQWTGGTSKVTLILLIQLGRTVAVSGTTRLVDTNMQGMSWGLTYDVSACLLTPIGRETDLQCEL